jgi:hypothetical protein
MPLPFKYSLKSQIVSNYRQHIAKKRDARQIKPPKYIQSNKD